MNSINNSGNWSHGITKKKGRLNEHKQIIERLAQRYKKARYQGQNDKEHKQPPNRLLYDRGA